MKQHKLMAVLAHPDDESLGTGGILAKYASEGVQVALVTATRGERGWFGAEEDYPGPQALGAIREKELQAAAQMLGIQQVDFLGYMDGELDLAEPAEIIARLVEHLRRFRPQVVVTFDPFGYYGHPDHIAIAQFSTAAIVAAADPSYNPSDGATAHRVDKLYYLAPSTELQTAYQAAFGELSMDIDGVVRNATPWPVWAITTRVDTRSHWRSVWKAISCHRSQLHEYQKLLDLPKTYHHTLWGEQTFFRALSLVNGSRNMETDLFAGLEERPVALAGEMSVLMQMKEDMQVSHER